MAMSRAGVSGGQGAQLQGQAFGQVARTDPVGSMFCRCFKCGFDFFRLECFEFGLQAGDDVRQRLGQETGVVEVVDQRGDQGAVTQGERADNQLVQQVFAQAGA